ncbi:hypothetical protein MMC28_005313 [Mycoblastus sanguinarius]|nr:hypothetical protein [Mycoblastus sanguinarius]
MKPSITLTLSALLALATAGPLKHAHVQHKRDIYTTTVIDEVVDVVDVMTTIYVQPGDPRLTQNQQSATAQVDSYTPAQVTSSSAIAAPQHVNQQAAYVPPPAPTTTPPQTPSSTPVTSTTPAPYTPLEVEAAIIPSSTLTPPAPAPSSTPASSEGSSPTASGGTPSGGTCGQPNGMCSAANVTTYDGAGADGACGYPADALGENYFALASDTMGAASNGNPLCNQTAVIVYNGQKYTGKLTDKCPSSPTSCGGESLDLSPALFASVFGGATTGNFHGVSWYFSD